MKKIILIVLAILILVAAFSAWKIFGPAAHQPDGKFFYIKTGLTYNDVTNDLVKNKIIGGKKWFYFVANRLSYQIIKPGKYEIKKGMSLFNLVRMLKNDRQTPVDLTIIKFRTKEDLARKIGREFETDSLQMISFLNDNDSLKHYGLDTNTWACAIIPNTYTYFWNSTPAKIFSKLYEESEKFWTKEKKQRAADLGLNSCEVYTLASIIEEETNMKADKGNMASVYLNRLHHDMPLGADPTIKFAMKQFGLTRIYENYLLYPSPYNTYKNKGLPPGPICTPSVETINEVLNSPKTDYFYFVAKSDFSGAHIFTTNYEEHKKYAKLFAEAQDKQDSIRKAKQTSK
jgi:UPF0755 protein